MSKDISAALYDWNNSVSMLNDDSDDVTLLAECALHISRIIEYPDLKVDPILVELNELGHDLYQSIRTYMPMRPTKIIENINNFLFSVKGFKPNIDDYNNPVNNYLNIVLKKRTGIPITLSIIYMCVSKGVDFKLYPVNFPGHFLIKHILDRNMNIIIDPFNNGRILDDYTLKEILDRSFPTQNLSITQKYIKKTTYKYVLIRILNNLKISFFESQDISKLELANEMILSLDLMNPEAIRDKGIILSHKNVLDKALEMLKLYLDIHPEAEDADLVLNIIRDIRKQS